MRCNEIQGLIGLFTIQHEHSGTFLPRLQPTTHFGRNYKNNSGILSGEWHAYVVAISDTSGSPNEKKVVHAIDRSGIDRSILDVVARMDEFYLLSQEGVGFCVREYPRRLAETIRRNIGCFVKSHSRSIAGSICVAFGFFFLFQHVICSKQDRSVGPLS